jgi:signal transduction histidine kinase
VIQFTDRAKEREIHLRTAVPEGLPPIMVNELRITQAIGNLVSNAIKYTPMGGEVSIVAERGEASVVVGVIDDGVGIARHDQAKLFQKFSRVGDQKMRTVAGTGLGLAIVRSVAESNSGRVWVESEIGEGSAFYLELPLFDQ